MELRIPPDRCLPSRLMIFVSLATSHRILRHVYMKTSFAIDWNDMTQPWGQPCQLELESLHQQIHLRSSEAIPAVHMHNT